jgi:drug/metabolite transporter (DMT)-like permease
MLGISLALLVSLLKALGDFWGKFFTSQRKSDTVNEYSLGLGIRVISTLILLPYILWTGFPSFSLAQVPLIIFTALGNAVATITLLKALKYGELSIVSPLNALSIPFLIFTSFIIAGELPNIYGFLGVIIVFIGTYLLGIGESWGKILSPLHSILSDRGSRWMILTAILMAITGPLDKLWVLKFGTLEWMFLTNIFVVIFIATYMKLSGKAFHGRKIKKPKHMFKAFIITLLWGTGAALQMLALKYTLVVYVLALKRASGIFSVLLGYFFFQEKNIRVKLFATGVMIVGIALITIFGA